MQVFPKILLEEIKYQAFNTTCKTKARIWKFWRKFASSVVYAWHQTSEIANPLSVEFKSLFFSCESEVFLQCAEA